MTSRRHVPIAVQKEVLIEAGYRCAVPTCRTILAIDLHHLIKVSDNGQDIASNLLALCPTCHALHHRGIIPTEAIKVWKSMLISLNQGFDKDAKDKLLFLALDHSPKLFASEGVLAFAGLITSGLVNCGLPNYSSIVRNGFHDFSKLRYPIELTEKGRLVVDAWRKGNQQELTDALAKSVERV